MKECTGFEQTFKAPWLRMFCQYRSFKLMYMYFMYFYHGYGPQSGYLVALHVPPHSELINMHHVCVICFSLQWAVISPYVRSNKSSSLLS